MNKTAAVILAAGKGTRMKSARKPKVLHEIAGKPMLGYVLDAADALGLDPAVTVIAPDMKAVEDFVAPRPVAVQEDALGTGHAVMAAKEALAGFDGDVLVLYGDSPAVSTESLTALMEARDEAAIAVLGFETDAPGAYGRLLLEPDNSLRGIVEAHDADEEQRAITACNGGILVAQGKILFDLLARLANDNAKGEYYLTDVIGIARKRGLKCRAVMAPSDELLGVNSRAELAHAEALMQDRLRRRAMEEGVTLTDPASVFLSHDTVLGNDVTIEPHVVIGPGVGIESGAVIRAFSHLEGARVGADAVIGPFARLRPGAEIGKTARVGNFVEVKKARLGEGAKANHLSYIGDAEIGARVNIGAGTITCNYDGFDKHRTEIGAGAFIGSNTALVAPVTVGKGAIVGAGSVITRDVSEDALGIARADQRAIEGWAAKFRKKKD